MTQVYSLRFSCAHFYKNLNWSELQNQETFGLCYSKEGRGHGHDYSVDVFVSANTDKSQVLQLIEQTLKRFDHKHLNYEIPELQNLVPTTENLAQILCHSFQQQLPDQFQKLKLYETKDLWVEIAP